jgi:hypothetical protein
MLAIQDEVSRATQEHLSRQLAVGTVLGQTMMRAVRQFAELNIGLVRATLEQMNFATRQLLSAGDSRQFLAMMAAQLQSDALRCLDYGYYCASIAAEAQTGVIKSLGGGMEETSREWAALAGLLDGSGPCGWRDTLSKVKVVTESASHYPADIARAARLALNINMPPSETGKLHIAYAGGQRRAK